MEFGGSQALRRSVQLRGRASLVFESQTMNFCYQEQPPRNLLPISIVSFDWFCVKMTQQERKNCVKLGQLSSREIIVNVVNLLVLDEVRPFDWSRLEYVNLLLWTVHGHFTLLRILVKQCKVKIGIRVVVAKLL